MGRRDRALALVFVLHLAWLGHGVRVSALLMLGALEVMAGGADLEWRGLVVRAWERRALGAFTAVMLVSRMVWYVLLSGLVFASFREWLRRSGVD